MGDPEGAGEYDDTVAAGRTLTTDHADLPVAGGWHQEGGSRYRLGDEIARGGGGRVVVARDLRLGREVAVKLPLDEPGSAERLVREAQLMSQLEHASIVPVHDLERSADATPFYVMKKLDGETLRARLAGKPFEERIALLPVLIQICDAVAYAHHRGIVHRDLKPANVIVGRFGETSVIDWGLARRVDAGDGAGAIVGTPAYMAPEQARGEPVDVRADVYGLGAMLYQVLGGEVPYARADDTADVIARVLAGPPPPIAQREPRVPPDLAAIVAKAMARDRDERYADAGQLAADLRRYQAGRLVAAHRYSVPQRVRRWLRRHRAPIGGAVVLTAAAAALIVAWPSHGRDPAAMCELAGKEAATIWTPAMRAGVVERVRATAVPGAAVMADNIAAGLDRRARELATARVEACAATHVRGEQSAELLDRRTSCLDRHRDTLAAVIRLFDAVAPGDVETLARAVDVVAGTADCADAVQLRAAAPLPADPAQRQQVLALQARAANAYALWLAGRFDASLAEARAVDADPAAALHPPLAARARYLVGVDLRELGKHAEAEPRLQEAIALAERARDDVGRGEDMLQLAYTLQALEREDDSRRVLTELEAVAARAGRGDLEAYRLNSLAEIAMRKGELAQALELGQRALAAMEQVGGEWELMAVEANLGVRYMSAGRWAEAEPHVRRSVELAERTRGPEHPHLAKLLRNLAAVLQSTGKAADAIPVYERALAILERAGMSESDTAISLRHNLPGALGMLHRYDEAEAAFLALRDLLERRPPSPRRDEQLATVTFNLGINRRMMGDAAGAARWFATSLATLEPIVGPRHIKVANGRWGLASAFIDQGKWAEAVPLLESALAVQLAETGPASQFTNLTLLGLMEAHVELGQASRALAYAARCEPYFAAAPDPSERGAFKFAHARALAAARPMSGADRARAVALATEARAEWERAGEPDRVKRADAWLAGHPP